MSGQSTTVTGSTHCINKGILYLESNNADHINEAILNILDDQIKTSLDLHYIGLLQGCISQCNI
jgi:hypothetical protein